MIHGKVCHFTGRRDNIFVALGARPRTDNWQLKGDNFQFKIKVKFLILRII